MEKSEHRKAYLKEYYLKNKEKRDEYLKEYRAKNRIYYREKNKKWSIENRDYMRNYLREYAKTEKWKIIFSNEKQKRRAKMKSFEKVSTEMLQDLIISQDYKCNKCSVFLDFNIKYFVHLDHIFPISKWGEHKILNLQYLCQTCNLQKYNKI